MYEAPAMPRRSRYESPTDVALTPIAEAAPHLTADERSKAPPELYLAGDRNLLRAEIRIAVVGSRDASIESQRRAARVARLIVENGGVVVSGLAKGIDRAAHEAAIAAGGKTVAVIGTPVEKAYPAEHAALQELIWREHLLV